MGVIQSVDDRLTTRFPAVVLDCWGGRGEEGRARGEASVTETVCDQQRLKHLLSGCLQKKVCQFLVYIINTTINQALILWHF